jgi:magnesium-transporting ATPase (P-type)
VFSNRWLIGGVSVMILLQLGYTYLPFMNIAFQSAPLGLAQWALILGASWVIWAAVGFEKWLRRKTAAA